MAQDTHDPWAIVSSQPIASAADAAHDPWAIVARDPTGGGDTLLKGSSGSMGRVAKDVAVGAGKAVNRTATGLLSLLAPGVGGMVKQGMQGVYGDQWDTPTNLPQTVGSVGTDIATSALPMGAMSKAASGFPVVARAAAEGLAGMGISAAQGHDPRSGLLAAVPTLVGGALSAGARAATKRIVGTADDAVADAAIKHRALPGILRGKTERADLAMARANAGVTDALAGQAGDTPVFFNAGDKIGKAVTEANVQPGTWAHDEAVDAAKNVMGKNLRQGRQPARALFQTAEAGRAETLGQTAPKAEVVKAYAAEARDAIARKVPSARPALQQVEEMVPVAEAMQHGPKGLVDTRSLPFYFGQALGLANRASNPVVQWSGDLGRLYLKTGGLSPVLRAALMQLMHDQPTNHEP